MSVKCKDCVIYKTYKPMCPEYKKEIKNPGKKIQCPKFVKWHGHPILNNRPTKIHPTVNSNEMLGSIYNGCEDLPKQNVWASIGRRLWPWLKGK